MAQVWHDRFAAYYRIWTPVYGLAADLTAYRATQLEPAAAWDRRIGTIGPEDMGYSAEEQAEGYLAFALYHYAHFEYELRQFQLLYGGQWLLSDAEAEQQLSNAVHGIWLRSPWNERDRSYLRTLVSDATRQEMHGFLHLLHSSELGRTTEQEWFEWAARCTCTWDTTNIDEEQPFPTARTQLTIATDYVIIRAAPGSSFALRASYDVPLSAEFVPPSKRAGRLRVAAAKYIPVLAWDRNNWRAVFGLWPFVHHISIVHQHETTSYHFRYSTEDDRYVYDVRLASNHSGSDTGRVFVTQADPASQALSYAHVHLNTLLAIAGSVLAIVSSVGSDHPAVHLFWRRATIAHPEWSVLLTLCAWNALNLSLRWWQNTRIVIERLRKRSQLAHYSV